LRFSPKFAIAVLTITLGAYAFAETLTGTVKNGTTNKPGAGDEVILIKLGNGMEEAARTKADSKGNFSFNLDDQGPHLIRAIHQGVTYHRMAPPGTTSVEVEVNDVAKKIDGISVTADVMRCQAENGQLEIVRLFAVDNKSNPPKTQMNDHNFEFYLPEGAKVTQAMARTANGQPLNSSAVPQGEKNKYAFIFPLRPGETQFQVQFTLPYSGEATVDPKLSYSAQHFVVMIPKSMQFTAGPNAHFDSMNDPQQSDATIQVATMTTAGQPLSFKLSGTGTLAAEGSGGGGGGNSGGSSSMGQNAESRSGPGGGLGPPIDAPDPLQKYRWPIIGGFVLVLAGGAFYMTKRQRAALASNGGTVDFDAPEPQRPITPRVSRPAPTPPTRVATSAPVATASAAAPAMAAPVATSAPRPSMLFEALKEEIFQLELEHKQGKISQQEYEKAKAALDGTLERAIKRDAQKN
jgi:hypothetical protein